MSEETRNEGEPVKVDLPKRDSDPEWHGTPEAIARLVQSVAEARLDFEPITKSTEGQFERRTIKYADLEAMKRATEPALSKNGVTVLQVPSGPDEDGRFRVWTMLCGHGAMLKSSLGFKLPAPRVEEGKYFDPSKPIKEFGGIRTYLCRYAYGALFQIAGEDEDADRRGESQPRQESRQRRDTPAKPQSVPRPASKGKGRVVNESGPAEDLGQLKASITSLAKEALGAHDVKTLAAHAEKALSKPWDAIKDDKTALMALEHALKAQAKGKSTPPPAPPSGDLTSDLHRLGAELGIPAKDDGTLVTGQLAQYVYQKSEEVLDDVLRDDAKLGMVVAAMKKDIEAGERWGA